MSKRSYFRFEEKAVHPAVKGFLETSFKAAVEAEFRLVCKEFSPHIKVVR